jgi:hypothetical protein
MRKAAIILLLISVIFIGCGRAKVTVEQAMSIARISFDRIFEEVDLDQEHKLVFYQNDDDLEIGWLDCTRNICKWIDSIRVANGSHIVSARYVRLNDQWPIFVGQIKDSRVNRVEVRTGEIVYVGNIIPFSELYRYWFVIPDQPKSLRVEYKFYQDNEILHRLGGLY